MSVALHHGDCRTIIPTLGLMVDSVVTDPPYDLVSITKRFGKPGSAAATSPDHARFARGFMGAQWDGEGVAFDPETWRVVGSVLRPGGFLLAFGAPRTHHRMACAIEDAGFVIQDCLMWLFATGFPKRRDAMKPAYEPIVLAYKPGGKRELGIDECRISSEGEKFGNAEEYAVRRGRQKQDGWLRPHHGGEADIARAALAIEKAESLGRWPANICHDGSDEVVGMFPERFGAASNSSKRTKSDTGWLTQERNKTLGLNDSGSAARFFFSSKAGTQDRWGSKHPTVKPVELMKWLVALVTRPGGTVLDPFAGSGTTGVAALATGRNCILIEREEQYNADIRERLAFYEGGGSHSMQAKNRNSKVEHGPLFEGAAE